MGIIQSLIKNGLTYVYGHKGHSVHHQKRFCRTFPVMRAIPSSENIVLYVSGPVSACWSWGPFPHQKIFIVRFRSWGPFPYNKIFYCTFPVMGAIYTWGPFIRTSWDSIPIKTRHIVRLRSWGPFMRTWFRFWVSVGWIIQRWNHFHLFCTFCAASPLFLGLASYLLDNCRIIVVMSRSVLCSRLIGCSSMHRSVHGVNEGTKSSRIYGDWAAIFFGGDHLGGAPESLARPVLVALGPARGEA